MKIYTKKGDDGSTGLFYGGRVSKSGSGPEAYGTVDEAVSALGVARSQATEPLASAILALQRQLFVVAAELATGAENRAKLEPEVSLVTVEMVEALEPLIDEIVERVGMPTEFIVPGGSPVAAALDAARTVVRRAERRAVAHSESGAMAGSYVVPYLNRLADLVYMLARSAEGEWISSKENG
ncbi:MAG: cob(I)yrinic acid a,c-diamide adenosyltransferase [Acidimicrobiia bacterium]|nr:cob(I)yrinic acid a,c-diamide adenosyltransferase [Acidimicrobiia bacterium]NNF64938.1 cob(I)yrinic acid a,c-diamide adenosyltransferase [Acidimicrobiia bacterium]